VDWSKLDNSLRLGGCRERDIQGGMRLRCKFGVRDDGARTSCQYFVHLVTNNVMPSIIANGCFWIVRSLPCCRENDDGHSALSASLSADIDI